MKALRLILTQSVACYRKEETLNNKMTYPLPPLSTVIGALHKACGYLEYHPMDISIQGNFDSLKRDYFNAPICLNTVYIDRGSLVKMPSVTKLSNAYTLVAKSIKRPSDFLKKENILIYDEKLLDDYINARKIALNKEMPKAEREQAKQITNSYRCFERYGKCHRELLIGVELVIHIRSDEKTLAEILENVYNIKSIGRSEDFIDLKEAIIVDLKQEAINLNSRYHAYLSIDDVRENNFVTFDGKSIQGTKYYLCKDYVINNKIREFNKSKVIYCSEYKINNFSNNIYEDGTYIVNLM